MKIVPKRLLFWAAVLLLVPAVLLGTVSCASLGYYASCTKGQFDLISRRQSITSLVCQPDIAPELKTKLENVVRIRDFASRELGLPDNGSYRSYVDVKRPYVVWNVVATPEFELKPLQWCFPVAGCVSYRGFFSEQDAGNFAKDLRDQGYDVYMYGVSAYSTLGWFDDPVLNTFFARSEEDLAGLIFHELAHQMVYVKNDSVFNESFAKAVELEGVTRLLSTRGKDERIESYLLDVDRHEQFSRLIMEFQNDLRRVYAGSLDESGKRSEKKNLFDRLRQSYAELKETWGGYRGYDRWFAELNNAKIASVSTYNTYVPAFQALLRKEKGNLERFYRAVAALGRLPENLRLARLQSLQTEFLAAEKEKGRSTPES